MPLFPLPLSPQSVAVMGNELAISWNDGEEQYLPLSSLRIACPCATCAGEPDVMGQTSLIRKTLTPESFLLTSYEFVGGYALQFQWNDGHRTGIYSYSYLRDLQN